MRWAISASMKTVFIQPRFEGDRFTEHTLPLDVAKDLAAYETLLVDVAKHLYLQDHKDRQRVPKGFANDFHLHLDRVDQGSTRPVLAVVASGLLGLGAGTDLYFERARDLISECIASPQGQLPALFPKELLSHFNQVGRSLREGEQMVLPINGDRTATLTPERRKSLVLAAYQVYEREIDLFGPIEEVDWEKSSFRLRSLRNGQRIIVPMPAAFHGRAREIGGRPRHLVSFTAVGAYDSWDNLQKVVSADSFEVQFNYEIAAKFDEIRSLQDGWFDGAGKAIDPDRLDAVADIFIQNYPENISLPTIVPTPEGDLLLEWPLNSQPTADIYLSESRADFHFFHADFSDEERSFQLITRDDWIVFFEQISKHLQTEA